MTDSDSDEDNVIRYGTPLEPYEEDELPTKRKYQQQPDQYAVDANGRRRFHGAFTGGFSAGYGNTVGTPEGWKPATFKSSRLEKAQVSSQRAEDFMDEEDRSEFGIAPRHMQTQSEFSGQKRLRQQRFHDGPIPGEPVLEQFVKAVHETAAVRMLRAMGWRPGQGAGERLSKVEKRKAKEQHKVYGCYMPPEMREDTEHNTSEESSEECDIETLFAPDDYEPYILNRKNDRFGLGYSGLSRHSVLGNLVGEYGSDGSRSHLVMKEKGKKVSIRGQAFGVGAFEADDEDIYATEDMSHYDFALGSTSDSKQKKSTVKQKGANILEGFVKSTKPLPAIPSYPPPALPRDYRPAVAGARRSRFEPSSQPQRDQGLGRHELTAEARGTLLGETPVPKVPDPEVPPPNPQTSQNININFISFTEPKTVKTDKIDFIPITDSNEKVNKVFRPFMSNPKKQARYELYVNDRDRYMLEGDSCADALSEWERNREIVEFEQAAKLYRPLTGVMSDRFTHASQPDDGVNPLCAVSKSAVSHGIATKEQMEAAEKGVYGVMTRRETSWRPDTLVCKRFNVPDPCGARPEQKKEDKPKVSYSIFSYLESSVHDKDSFAKEQSKFSGSKSLENVPNIQKDKVENTNTPTSSRNEISSKTITSNEITSFAKRMTVAELFMKESENDMKKQVEVTQTIEKFDKMDLYKSIFLSDSEEETQNVGDGSNFVDTPKNVERNTSPPRGIFANIDFDELNSWKRNADTKKSNTSGDTGKDLNVDSNTSKSDSANIQKNNNVASSNIDDGKSKKDLNIDGNTSKSDSANIEKINNVASSNVEDGNKSDNAKTISDCVSEEAYGPKIPENLLKKLEVPEVNFRPIFRSKSKIEHDSIQVDSSSSDSWVDAKEVKSKKQKKKKSKKHKSKHKKSKHKKKDK